MYGFLNFSSSYLCFSVISNDEMNSAVQDIHFAYYFFTVYAEKNTSMLSYWKRSRFLSEQYIK
jgi:hypothetical protein